MLLCVRRCTDVTKIPTRKVRGGSNLSLFLSVIATVRKDTFVKHFASVSFSTLFFEGFFFVSLSNCSFIFYISVIKMSIVMSIINS